MLYQIILEKLQVIIASDIETASAQIFQTKALIENCVGGNGIDELKMTKAVWDSIIKEIIVRERNGIAIRLGTGMIVGVPLC